MKILRLLKRYGFFGFLRLINDVIISRLLVGNVRIIRRPFYIRGVNGVVFGQAFTAGVGLRIDVEGEGKKLYIGDNVQVNDYVHIGVVKKVVIGNNVLIASKVFISDHNHGSFKRENFHEELQLPPLQRPLEAFEVNIGENVWIGENVSILPGVTIGKNAVIGAGSVVTKDIPDNCIAVGVPAKVLKKMI